jgi:hypothetical protein
LPDDVRRQLAQIASRAEEELAKLQFVS